MKHTLFFALSCTLLLLNAKCGKDDCEVVPGGRKYTAWTPIIYSPMKEKFKVGDTITIEIQVPNELKDTLSGESLTMGDVVFDDVWGGDIGGGVARFIKTHQDSTIWIYAANEFDFIQQNGKVQVTGGSISALAVTFSQQPQKIRIAKFQMITRRSGSYNLGFFTPALNVTDQIGNYCSAALQLYFGDSVAYNYHLLTGFDIKKIGTYEQNRGTFSFIVEE